MSARLRRATPADLEAILAVKRALPMPGGESTQRGGFLLGCDPRTYAALVELAQVWLLELDERVVGFSVTFDDAVLRGSELWRRREHIEWQPSFDAEAKLDLRIGYFDQLAVLPLARARYWGAALGLRALAELFEAKQHQLVLTTTVIAPIRNAAALPYLTRVGARRVGRLDEHYPGVGPVSSALYAIEARRYDAALASLLAAGRPATCRMIEAARPA